METGNKVNLTCNQCGSNSVEKESDDTYVCKNYIIFLGEKI